MFLRAAERLALAPAACVAVEDSPPGVAAARAAGMPTLGVRRVPSIDLSAATRVVDEVSADAILELANQ
jgi:beta-phosphoglucomutase-like phosphatase (HAD superfamily)